MIERTISQSMYDARIKKPDETKRNIYREYLDDLTLRKLRREAQGLPWTPEDESEYNTAYNKCVELIAEVDKVPVFNEGEKLVVVSDEEYAELLRKEAEKAQALEPTPEAPAPEELAPEAPAPAEEKATTKKTKKK